MDAFEEPAEAIARGLSRRQLLGRVGGGLAGVTLASLGLEGGRSAVAAPAPVSLRRLLRGISAKGCDPSHGIRVILPNDHPFISIRKMIRDYDGSGDWCVQPPPAPPAPPAPAGGGSTTKPSISVSQQGFTFTVGGKGFLPSHAVHILVVNNTNFASSTFHTRSDEAGGINFGINIPCVPGVPLSFSANDDRQDAQYAGALWSNTVTVTCA